MDEQQTPQKLHPTNNQKTVKKKSIPFNEFESINADDDAAFDL